MRHSAIRFCYGGNCNSWTDAPKSALGEKDSLRTYDGIRIVAQLSFAHAPSSSAHHEPLPPGNMRSDRHGPPKQWCWIHQKDTDRNKISSHTNANSDAARKNVSTFDHFFDLVYWVTFALIFAPHSLFMIFRRQWSWFWVDGSVGDDD